MTGLALAPRQRCCICGPCSCACGADALRDEDGTLILDESGECINLESVTGWDTFTDADGTPLGLHIPEAGLWVDDTPGITIVDGNARLPGALAMAYMLGGTEGRVAFEVRDDNAAAVFGVAMVDAGSGDGVAIGSSLGTWSMNPSGVETASDTLDYQAAVGDRITLSTLDGQARTYINADLVAEAPLTGTYGLVGQWQLLGALAAAAIDNWVLEA